MMLPLIIKLITLYLFSYLLGSIPTGLLIAKLKGIDIRKVGSGNIGGTNVARALGLKWGILVGLLDSSKGFLVALFALKLYQSPLLIISFSLMPVMGYVFPIWLNFKGGKGVSVIYGMLLAFWGIKFFLIWLVVWLILVYFIKLMSLVNLLLALFLPVVFWLIDHSWVYVGFGFLLTLIIWYTHWDNIKRLLQGKENKLKF